MEAHGHKGIEPDATREIRRDTRCDERPELSGEAGLAAVLQPVDRLAERALVRARGDEREGAEAAFDGIRPVAALDAVPAPAPSATGAARRDDDVEQPFDGLQM